MFSQFSSDDVYFPLILLLLYCCSSLVSITALSITYFSSCEQFLIVKQQENSEKLLSVLKRILLPREEKQVVTQVTHRGSVAYGRRPSWFSSIPPTLIWDKVFSLQLHFHISCPHFPTLCSGMSDVAVGWHYCSQALVQQNSMLWDSLSP